MVIMQKNDANTISHAQPPSGGSMGAVSRMDENIADNRFRKLKSS